MEVKGKEACKTNLGLYEPTFLTTNKLYTKYQTN